MIKKEVTLAIIIGFALGLLITFGIWTANKSLKQAQLTNLASITPTPVADVTPAPSTTVPTTSPSTTGLTITSPSDETLTNTDSVTLTGLASPNASIVILDENTENVVQADQSGKFSSTVSLETGFNRIRVISYDPSGKSESKTIVVTYTTAKI